MSQPLTTRQLALKSSLIAEPDDDDELDADLDLNEDGAEDDDDDEELKTTAAAGARTPSTRRPAAHANVPSKPPKPRKRRLSLHLPPDLIQRLKLMAVEENATASGLVVLALKQYLGPATAAR